MHNKYFIEFIKILKLLFICLSYQMRNQITNTISIIVIAIIMQR